MRDKAATLDYYVNQLGFAVLGDADYPEYLMVGRDGVELHFFLFRELNPTENYGQVYLRCVGISEFYQALVDRGVAIHPNGSLMRKPWGQVEFSLLDPDHNLLTFGEAF